MTERATPETFDAESQEVVTGCLTRVRASGENEDVKVVLTNVITRRFAEFMQSVSTEDRKNPDALSTKLNTLRALMESGLLSQLTPPSTSQKDAVN